MNEFKSPHEHSSAPLTFEQEKWVSEDSPRRGTRTTNSSRDLPELPKSSRRHSSTSNITDSPTKEKSDKQKSRRSSKTSKSREDGNKPTRLPVDLVQESASPSRSLPDIPKKTRRKKSKDSGGSTRLRSKAQITETYQSPYSDPGIDTESLPRPSDGGLSQKSFEEEDEKGFRGIS
ncbi:CRIB domain-containing protein [Quillaja saponaria]|uniref:CRIB domain-containing protein n=1 Tax=Quillaja saponaria TaxID=32244 RepID=A0AAD7VEF0_QUISA|nr:CRIB domain-containing protein [Quillaja saponaria]